MTRIRRFDRIGSVLLGLFLAGVAGCEGESSAPLAEAPGIQLARIITYDAWSLASRVEAIPGTDPTFNTPQLDGCPFISRDGKTFYMASTRPGGLGGLDIWVATRESENDTWGAPVNVGAPINSTANDFCPTIARDGHLFYFVSNRSGGCGGSDIYVSRIGEDGSIKEPENLGCTVNSAADEQSPFPLPAQGTGPVLYFSSFRAGGFAADPDGATTGDSDIYMSESRGGVFGAAQLVPGVNSTASDGQPNVRRDGLEIFFFSNRPGTLGGTDIYGATRSNPMSSWGTPVNLGQNVNTAYAESRPSLSWDATVLYFGSTRPLGDGDADTYVSYRARLDGASSN